jgi:protein-L-isoaspartate(D-aspartate) O-methyltransferase
MLSASRGRGSVILSVDAPRAVYLIALELPSILCKGGCSEKGKNVMTSDTFAAQRQEMVQTQLMARGITDAAVLTAMRAVPREAFVLPELVDFAYDDLPIPIGENQTISQPYIVALMSQVLQLSPQDRVLEIGTGSGYAAAVLSCIVQDVYTVERLEPFYHLARQRLARLGYHNVHVHLANGTLGWPAHAPYDGIVVTAGGPKIPAALQKQLAPGGRLVMPVGTQPHSQTLVRVTRECHEVFRQDNLSLVRFVPLIGAEGWPEHRMERKSLRDTVAEFVASQYGKDAP